MTDDVCREVFWRILGHLFMTKITQVDLFIHLLVALYHTIIALLRSPKGDLTKYNNAIHHLYIFHRKTSHVIRHTAFHCCPQFSSDQDSIVHS